MERKFTEEAALAVNIAFSEAARCGAGYVGSEHLLIGLALQDGDAGRLLASCGGTPAALRARVERYCEGTTLCEDMTPTLKRILMKAAALAGKGRRVCGAHLLSALLSENCAGKRAAEEVCGTGPLYEGIEKLLLEEKMLQRGKKAEARPTPLLDKNGRDLTERALAGGTDPVIGREAEEERVIRILLRRQKNNPCLVGEPGVGKTAVAEAVARRIAEGKVPDALKGRRVVALDLPSLIAGTKYRGEFEDKLRGIIDEVQSAGNVILFIDELHTVVGAGAAEGAIDASNILKPYLARGELQLIGATTLKEYKRFIEKDGALERRFQRVLLEEPTAEEAVCILRGLRAKYEDYHSVKISDGALCAAAELSERFITDRHLPDKAIDLMDEAAAAKRLECAHGKRCGAVGREDVEAALEAWLGVKLSVGPIPEEEICALKARLCGQEDAVDAVAASLNRCRAGLFLADEAPLCSFLFTGAPGTGKRRLAREAAKLMFGSDKRFVRFDMSEYAEPHNLPRLTGAAPGCAGFEDGGALTEWVRKSPCSLIFFDNAQSACPEALAVIRRILEEGCLTDSCGRRISFRSSVIAVAADTPVGASAGFVAGGGGSLDKRLCAIGERVDEWVRFKPLDKKALSAAAERCLAQMNLRLAPFGMRLGEEAGFADSIVERFAKRGLGASALYRTLGKQAKRLFCENGAKNS